MRPLLHLVVELGVITGVFDYERPSIMQAGGFYLDRPWWQRLLIRWSLRQANANVFLSRFEEKQITRIFGIQTSSYAPCAVDTDRYFPIPGDKLPLILNVAWSGKLNAERKCLPQIVAALPAIRRHYPNVRLIMAGKQGEYHPRLIELAEHYGVADAIDFLGVISEEYKIALMQQAAVYLQPSLFEGFGLATAEAMACGAAVVSSPVGAVPEVIGDAGLLIAGDEPDVIADAVIRVLADDTLMRELGTRARARIVRDYGYEQRKQLIKAVIEEQVL
jgi:glycosyltransferase involved in cell wall biosynthesis